MRWAVAACALGIAAFIGVFGFLVVNRTQPTEPAASTAPVVSASAENRPVARTVVDVAAPAPAPVHAAAANPAPAHSTIAQRAAEQSFAQATPPSQASTTSPTAPPAAAQPAASCPGNPDAIGIARTVEIDTTGGPGFGNEHFRQHDFLEPGEVVLTFDDGPWPQRTTAVLAALAAHCTKAVFFPIGKHATYEPSILKQVAAAGHSVGSHTWAHTNLAKKGMPIQEAKDEIEKGISAVAWAVGGPTAPYFRFPQLRHPPELVSYLGERNIGIFSTDMDSFDFKMRKPEQVRQSVLAKLKKHGKGIVLMHDFQQATAAAASELLNDLKANGYKVVHMRPKFAVTTIASYDEEVRKNQRPPAASTRPTSSVVRTVD